MAAGQAAAGGAAVSLLEKNDRPGRKLMITGKGRCNLTNATDIQGLIKNIPGNGRFLYSAFDMFDNHDLVRFFHGLGVETKVERGDRVFPVSDKAGDIVEALVCFCREQQVKIVYGQPVAEITRQDGTVTGVVTGAGDTYQADRVILASGGASYPGTGSTGDGYTMARKLGHTVVPVKPALVPLVAADPWVKELQGLTLKNVAVTACSGGKTLVEEFGEMIFTHFGLSGPIILTLSRKIAQLLEKGQEIILGINLKPAIGQEQLDRRIQRDFTSYQNKQFKNSLGELLPKSLIPVVIQLSGISGEKPVHQVTKEERLRLVNLLQNLEVTVTGTRSIKEAIVTAGGVSVKEINPRTMESKLIRGLFFAGEVIDVDGYTGGFNLQIAFSTGYMAGRSAAE
jgi:predicted Rossmann fold flavoprotein